MLYVQLYKPQQSPRAVLARDVPAGAMSGLPSALSHSRRCRRRSSKQRQRTGGPGAQRASWRDGGRVGSSQVHTLRKRLPLGGIHSFLNITELCTHKSHVVHVIPGMQYAVLCNLDLYCFQWCRILFYKWVLSFLK